VLVVDDAPFAGQVVETLRDGLDAVALDRVADRRGALEYLGDRVVDCVVIATEAGDSLLEAVRTEDETVPVILVTPDADGAAVGAALASGADDVLSVPTEESGAELLGRRVRAAVEEHRSRRLLAERNRRLETLVSNLPGMVYRCRNEPDWPMQYVRGECEALTGYDAGAIESGEVSWGSEVVHPDDRERVWDAVQDALDDREAFEVTYRIQTRDGEVRHVWERGRGLYDGDDLEALEGFITDVTARERQKQQLERERDRLEDFVDVVSHDLRNPLNVAQANLELAREDPDPEYLDAVDRSLERMETLIADLLELAREGEGVSETRPVALDRVVERCWEQVATGGADLEVDADCTVRADESRLRQLLENLFRNAVEHSSTSPRSRARGDTVEHSSTSNRPQADDAVEHGSTNTPWADERGAAESGPGAGSADRGEALTRGGAGGDGDGTESDGGADQGGADAVTVRVGELPGRPGFYVADDGPGIPASERDRVFETGYSTAPDGSGFGLAIVESIASAHGWSVSVEESWAGGARFEFEGGQA